MLYSTAGMFPSVMLFSFIGSQLKHMIDPEREPLTQDEVHMLLSIGVLSCVSAIIVTKYTTDIIRKYTKMESEEKSSADVENQKEKVEKEKKDNEIEKEK